MQPACHCDNCYLSYTYRAYIADMSDSDCLRNRYRLSNEVDHEQRAESRSNLHRGGVTWCIKSRGLPDASEAEAKDQIGSECSCVNLVSRRGLFGTGENRWREKGFGGLGCARRRGEIYGRPVHTVRGQCRIQE